MAQLTKAFAAERKKPRPLKSGVMCRNHSKNMSEEANKNKVLQLAVEAWNKNFAGISALDISKKTGIPNTEVMESMERLCVQNKGTINRNVELYQISFDPENPKIEFPNTPITTHIFFPDKKILVEHFYSTSLVQGKYPEYKNRMHQGAHQLGMVFFSDEVLARYFDHPELYEIEDTLAGGHIMVKDGTPDSRYLYVRYGKRKLKNGNLSVTAIYKDLYSMSAEEQRHWHAHEFAELEGDSHDPNFQKFLARTYEGEFVTYPNPIKEVSEALDLINKQFSLGHLFKRTSNKYLRMPVENTQKALYDCCSELYKLIGPDSLDNKLMVKYLKEKFNVEENELMHKESGRPLSSLQLLTLVEIKSGIYHNFTQAIKDIGKLRIEADHKISTATPDDQNYVEIFTDLCGQISSSGNYFALSIQ